MTDYEVIIVGGGPVGVALAIELGLQNIKTLVLEKHKKPLHAPRAQSLSARSMEFFLRWGIDDALMERLLLPKDLPQMGIWCSSLCGESYFEGAWGDNKLASNSSPKAGVRVPLWVTEDVLQKRLLDFECVDFLKSNELQDIRLLQDKILVESLDKDTQELKTYQSNFLACCDGVSGKTKSILNNPYNKLSDKTQMLATMFISKEIIEKKTVADGIMYFVIADCAMAFVGPIDLNQGLWHAQIVWPESNLAPDEAILSNIINDLIGTPIQKEIVSYYFWDLQVQIASFFNLDNRVFWLGDAAHAFAPTGGLGLNTGLGDAENLGWKLAHVIKKEESKDILATYQAERYGVWLNNLNFAKQNAEEFINLKKQFDPVNDPRGFAMAYADLGDRFLSSSGLTLGYAYFDSTLTKLLPGQNQQLDCFKYQPKVEPGYFLPHVEIDGKPIYSLLSPISWILIVNRNKKFSLPDQKTLAKLFRLNSLDIMEVPSAIYPFDFLLIRPDWHIACVGNSLDMVLNHMLGEKNEI